MVPKPSLSPPCSAAAFLHKHLRAKKRGRAVSLPALTALFETCYFASLQGEENRPTLVTLAFMDPRNPDPTAPPTIRPQRWTAHPLETKLDMTVRNLVKLAPSASPSSTIIAVFEDSSVPYIWGLVDQQTDFREAFDREKYDVAHFPRPGLFQVEIVAPGTLTVFDDMHSVLTLHESSLTTGDSDVFHYGPVAALLRTYVDACSKRALAKLSHARTRRAEAAPRPEDVRALCHSIWIASLCRIVLRIRRRKHGGALLLSPSSSVRLLSCKYQLRYLRLESILIDHAIALATTWAARDAIHQHVKAARTDIPSPLYFQRTIAEITVDDCIDAATGCVSFIAALASVDGLVLLQKGLDVGAYGVEVTRRVDPPRVYSSSTASATRRSLRRIDPQDFGTRHRSMMRYCHAAPGSIGFVVSQDGHVRCMTRVKGDVVVWDNVRLQGWPAGIKEAAHSKKRLKVPARGN